MIEWASVIFFTNLSQPFTSAVGALGIALDDLQGGEVYYNYEVTPWFHLTADLQAIQPQTASQDTAIVLGLRAKLDL